MNKKVKQKTLYGLSLATVEQIHGVFREHPSIEKVVLYGSRAMGNYRRGSDIDLTLHGETLTYQDECKIAAALDDLPTPYMFDVSIFDTLNNDKLRDHIERKGVVFYERIGDGRPLPKGWKMVALGEVSTINPEKPKLLKDRELKVSFVPMSDINEHNSYFDIKKQVKVFDVSKGYRYFKNDDVILAKITPWSKMGQGAIAKMGRVLLQEIY